MKRQIKIQKFIEEGPHAVFFGPDDGYIRLNHNETTGLLTSPMQKEIFLGNAHAVSEYPSYQHLHRAIARYARVPHSWVQTANGSDDAIPKLVRLLFQGKRKVILPVPTFPTYERALRLEKIPIHFIPHTVSGNSFIFPTDRVLEAIQTGTTQGVMLCNPGNPLGAGIPLQELLKILQSAAKKDIPVVVDEAYLEFNGVSAVPYIKRYPNTIVLRTFSKTFGLAGLRIGYVIAVPAVIQSLQKLILPWEVNHIATRAGITVLKHKSYFLKQLKKTVTRREVMRTLFEKAGVQTFASRANFLVCKTPKMKALLATLKKRKIVVKSMGPASGHMPFLSDCFRISVPGPDQAGKAMQALRQALGDFTK